MPHDETQQSARQLIKSLKKYQLNELAILLAAIHEEDTSHCVALITYEELRTAKRFEEAESFIAVHQNMLEVH